MPPDRTLIAWNNKTKMILAQTLRWRAVAAAELNMLKLILETIFDLLRLRQTGGATGTLIKMLLNPGFSLAIKRSCKFVVS